MGTQKPLSSRNRSSLACKDMIPTGYVLGDLGEARKAWQREVGDLESRGVMGC